MDVDKEKCFKEHYFQPMKIQSLLIDVIDLNKPIIILDDNVIQQYVTNDRYSDNSDLEDISSPRSVVKDLATVLELSSPFPSSDEDELSNYPLESMYDPLFSLCILSPFFSIRELYKLTSKSEVVTLKHLPLFFKQRGDEDIPFVVGGVLAKRDQTVLFLGTRCVSWSFTDLNRFEINFATLFVFENSTILSRMQAGMCITLFNPIIQEWEFNNVNYMVMFIHEDSQFLFLGMSAEIALCSGKNGIPCDNIINSQSNYCSIHNNMLENSKITPKK